VNNMEALPAPDPAGAASWPLSRDPKFFAWLMAALRPAGPYPILVLKGPSGAGKSTAARMLRALIDPAASLFCALPATEGDLRALAWDNRVLAFDHMTAFPARIAAGLRRLCSGDLERPILLTVSGDAFPGHCADLWNHAMVAELPAIDPKHRLSQSRLWREFEEARPGLLAALCDGVSEAMRNADQISLESPSAFADAAAWAVAAAPALGFTEAAMRAAVSPHPAAASAPVSSAGFLR